MSNITSPGEGVSRLLRPTKLAVGLTALFAAAAASHGHSQDRPGTPIRTETLDPQPIRIMVDSLPEPYASDSADKHPKELPPPADATLKVPAGFKVNVFADNVEKARWLALTPEGDVLCSSGRTNKIHLLRDTDGDGTADERHVFLDESRGANLPFGMDFAQVDGKWYFFLANTNGVMRYPYESGQTQLAGEHDLITQLPGQGYNQHWTRNVRVTPDRQHLMVTVGSESNADAEAPPRAAVLKMKLDGSDRETFAFGLRNPVGLDFQPQTNEPYVNVNERDKIGDGLVPDYLTRVQAGKFYGWPYSYFTPQRLDPRHAKDGVSDRPDLVAKTTMPDVLYESHSAALGLAFCTSEKFPEKYRGGAFTVMRGSWNRETGTGYKLVFVPFDGSGTPADYYEDFLTGFLLDPQVPTTWGRPVGAIFASDGSLLFTEESNGRIYRVTYEG